jgi:hypothetical protein
MVFNINKNATLPTLRLELINDGRNDFHKFHEKIQNANIFFTMTELETGVKRISKKVTYPIQKLPESDCVGEEFFVGYQFTSRETSKSGTYVGHFEIDFLDGSGTLIVPIQEPLYINILDQGLKK